MLFQPLKHLIGIFVVIVSIFASDHILATTQAETAAVNFLQIKEFANFANAAYQPAPKIRELDFFKPYTLTHYSNIPEIEISYFIATNDSAKT